MDAKNLYYLLLARYVTYIAVFVISIIGLGKDFSTIVFFSLLFILVLLNSSVRLTKLNDKLYSFTVSCLIEIIAIVYMQFEFNSLAFMYLYITAVDIYMMLRLKHALYLSIAVYLGIGLCSLPTSGYIDLNTMVVDFTTNASIMVFFCGAAYAIRMELKRRGEIQSLYEELKKSQIELEEAHRKLKEYADKVENIAVLSERNRLASEIHDTLGHSLTGLIMEIDICGKLIDKDIIKTKEELKKASELARNALSQVRRSVKAIKPSNMDNLTGIHAINELIRDFEKNTRIAVKFKVSKQQYRLSPAVEVTIYRTIQEALTNCAKHGGADSVEVELDFKEHEVELNIKDNGSGCKEFIKGVGIMTMEERILSLGGSLKISGDNGFIVNAVIPVEVV